MWAVLRRTVAQGYGGGYGRDQDNIRNGCSRAEARLASRSRERILPLTGSYKESGFQGCDRSFPGQTMKFPRTTSTENTGGFSRESSCEQGDIVHVISRILSSSGVENVKKPLGMKGVRLEAEVFNRRPVPILRNLARC